MKLGLAPSLLIVVAVVLGWGDLVHAQEIAWRQSYAAARKEATQTGRPLLLDFGFDACVWCRKQDATTFRDPRVVKLLNEGFIPVKIDAQRDDRVVRALGIESFPSLVLGSAEGKVLGRHEGYADVSQLTALLGKAPASAAPAGKPTQEPANRPRFDPGLPEVPGKQQDMLKLAREDYEAGRFAESLRRCSSITTGAATAAEVLEAQRLVQQISSNAAAQRLVNQQIAADLAKLQPILAAALEK
jgi:thioredoxin-related protein